MKNIKILKKGIDVSKVKEQLEQYSDDWYIQRKGSDTLLEKGYADIDVGNLQLIMGAVAEKDDFVGDSELSKPTPAYGRHTEILRIIEKEMPGRELHRCGFLSLPIDGYVGAHIDEGTYYLTRDRYHISIAGQYQYFVGNESVIVDEGTFFWFNNKMPHGAVNLGDETRITFVFDMPHGQG
tara:strand:- start:522 stop:1064 length:543 start_codon:yes stop_codon:yes gene_type:complete